MPYFTNIKLTAVSKRVRTKYSSQGFKPLTTNLASFFYVALRLTIDFEKDFFEVYGLTHVFKAVTHYN
jgi:hypothetical protein